MKNLTREQVVWRVIVIVFLVIPVLALVGHEIRQSIERSTCVDLDDKKYKGLYSGWMSEVGFRECLGVISVGYFNDLDEYMIQDNHHDTLLTVVEYPNQYELISGYIYIYDPVTKVQAERLETGKIHSRYLIIDDEEIRHTYNYISEVHEYLKVDSSTGNVVGLYATPNEIPPEDQSIFNELEEAYRKHKGI